MKKRFDEPKDWQSGDRFVGEYDDHPISGVVWDRGGYLYVGSTLLRHPYGRRPAHKITGYTIRKIPSLPEPTKTWTRVEFTDGFVVFRVPPTATYRERGWMSVDGSMWIWQELLQCHHTVAQVYPPDPAPMVDVHLVELTQRVRQEVARMESMIPQRRTGASDEVLEELYTVRANLREALRAAGQDG